MYKVLMMNDDYTPMEFVVHVLQHFFNLSNSQANAIMLNVHRRGIGVCGVFSYEVAEAKATKVMEYARQNEHPLQLQLEKGIKDNAFKENLKKPCAGRWARLR